MEFSLNSSSIDAPRINSGSKKPRLWTAELFLYFLQSTDSLNPANEALFEQALDALDLHDLEFTGHTQRVSHLTLKLSMQVGIPQKDLGNIYRGAILHDIGKMGIPTPILLKPGPLTETEWASIRQHPIIAYNLLSQISSFRRSLDIPYYHHERWNGAGYPKGLQGRDIPLSARIFTVVDVWDALTSDRPYRKAWPLDQAIEYIQRESGQYFDPEIVKLFTELIKRAE